MKEVIDYAAQIGVGELCMRSQPSSLESNRRLLAHVAGGGWSYKIDETGKYPLISMLKK